MSSATENWIDSYLDARVAQIFNNYLQRCSNSLAIMEMKIRIIYTQIGKNYDSKY
jgi:hypothetical protein